MVTPWTATTHTVTVISAALLLRFYVIYRNKMAEGKLDVRDSVTAQFDP